MELRAAWICVLIYLVSSAMSQKLVIDPDGVYHYDDYQGDNGLRRKICFVENPNLNTCGKQYPILAMKNKARNFVGDHAIFFIWPYPRVQHAPTPIVTTDPSFDLKFWMQRKVWKLTNGWSDEPNKLKYKNKVDETEEFQQETYDDNYDMYYDDTDFERMNQQAKKDRQDFYDQDFHSFFINGGRGKLSRNINRRSARRIPFVVPMNVSGCVPRNNTYCNEGDIRTYENYLDANSNYRSSRTNLCPFDENNLKFESMYYAIDSIKNVTALTIIRQTSEFDDEVTTKLVADKLVQLVGQKCAANVNNVQIRIYDFTEGEGYKIKALIHIQRNENKNEEDEEDAILF